MIKFLKLNSELSHLNWKIPFVEKGFNSYKKVSFLYILIFKCLNSILTLFQVSNVKSERSKDITGPLKYNWGSVVFVEGMYKSNINAESSIKLYSTS